MDFTKYYTLTYKLRTNPQWHTLFFKFDGTLEDATLRGQRFCASMDFYFKSVYPMITDLDKREDRYLNRSAVYQGPAAPVELAK